MQDIRTGRLVLWYSLAWIGGVALCILLAVLLSNVVPDQFRPGLSFWIVMALPLLAGIWLFRQVFTRATGTAFGPRFWPVAVVFVFAVFVGLDWLAIERVIRALTMLMLTGALWFLGGLALVWLGALRRRAP